MRITLHYRHIRYDADVPIVRFQMDEYVEGVGHYLHKYDGTLVRLHDDVRGIEAINMQYDDEFTAELYDGELHDVYGDELTRVFL